MQLRLKRLRSGNGIFVQVKPFPVSCEVGGIVTLEEKQGYALLGEYGDMFEIVQPSEPKTVSRVIPAAPNKSMDKACEEKVEK